jgi:hypothetical protein
MERGNRGSRGMIRFDVSLPSLSRPEPLEEPDDMVRVDFLCHPKESPQGGQGMEPRGSLPSVRRPLSGRASKGFARRLRRRMNVCSDLVVLGPTQDLRSEVQIQDTVYPRS